MKLLGGGDYSIGNSQSYQALFNSLNRSSENVRLLKEEIEAEQVKKQLENETERKKGPPRSAPQSKARIGTMKDVIGGSSDGSGALRLASTDDSNLYSSSKR